MPGALAASAGTPGVFDGGVFRPVVLGHAFQRLRACPPGLRILIRPDGTGYLASSAACHARRFGRACLHEHVLLKHAHARPWAWHPALEATSVVLVRTASHTPSKSSFASAGFSPYNQSLIIERTTLDRAPLALPHGSGRTKTGGIGSALKRNDEPAHVGF